MFRSYDHLQVEIYAGVPGGNVNIVGGGGVVVSVISNKKAFVLMCPIPNGFPR
jgi:hypothetical protein